VALSGGIGHQEIQSWRLEFFGREANLKTYYPKLALRFSILGRDMARRFLTFTTTFAVKKMYPVAKLLRWISRLVA